jgi:hypothetical protein
MHELPMIAANPIEYPAFALKSLNDFSHLGGHEQSSVAD